MSRHRFKVVRALICHTTFNIHQPCDPYQLNQRIVMVMDAATTGGIPFYQQNRQTNQYPMGSTYPQDWIKQPLNCDLDGHSDSRQVWKDCYFSIAQVVFQFDQTGVHKFIELNILWYSVCASLGLISDKVCSPDYMYCLV